MAQNSPQPADGLIILDSEDDTESDSTSPDPEEDSSTADDEEEEEEDEEDVVFIRETPAIIESSDEDDVIFLTSVGPEPLDLSSDCIKDDTGTENSASTMPNKVKQQGSRPDSRSEKVTEEGNDPLGLSCLTENDKNLLKSLDATDLHHDSNSACNKSSLPAKPSPLMTQTVGQDVHNIVPDQDNSVVATVTSSVICDKKPAAAAAADTSPWKFISADAAAKVTNIINKNKNTDINQINMVTPFTNSDAKTQDVNSAGITNTDRTSSAVATDLNSSGVGTSDRSSSDKTSSLSFSSLLDNLQNSLLEDLSNFQPPPVPPSTSSSLNLSQPVIVTPSTSQAGSSTDTKTLANPSDDCVINITPVNKISRGSAVVTGNLLNDAFVSYPDQTVPELLGTSLHLKAKNKQNSIPVSLVLPPAGVSVKKEGAFSSLLSTTGDHTSSTSSQTLSSSAISSSSASSSLTIASTSCSSSSSSSSSFSSSSSRHQYSQILDDKTFSLLKADLGLGSSSHHSSRKHHHTCSAKTANHNVPFKKRCLTACDDTKRSSSSASTAPSGCLGNLANGGHSSNRCCRCQLLVPYEDLSRCTQGHACCGTCLQQLTKTILSKGKKASLQCTFPSCNAYFSISELERTLPKMVVDILEEKLDQEYVDYASALTWRQLVSDDETPETTAPVEEEEEIPKVVPKTERAGSLLCHVPPSWEAMDDTSGFKLVDLEGGSEEYLSCAILFHNTMIYPRADIQKIQRVQNPILWQFYTVKKTQMECQNSGQGPGPGEMQLFHGTTRQVLEAICKNGFDWRLSGIHGTMYGQGSYFARDASYSHTYTDKHPLLYSTLTSNSHFNLLTSQARQMILSMGNSTARHPPLSSGHSHSLRRTFHLLQHHHQKIARQQRRCLGPFRPPGTSGTSQSALPTPPPAHSNPYIHVSLPLHPQAPVSNTQPAPAHSTGGTTSTGTISRSSCNNNATSNPGSSSSGHNSSVGTSQSDTQLPVSSSSSSSSSSSFTGLKIPNPFFLDPSFYPSPQSFTIPSGPAAPVPPPPPPPPPSAPTPSSSFDSQPPAPRKKHTHVMFLSRVLVGQYAPGKPIFRKPPPIDPNNPYGPAYDSCTDNVHNPKIFVVFDSAQSYPEYVIEYTNEVACSCTCPCTCNR